MFLCQLDGKLFNDDHKSLLITLEQLNLQNIKKEIKVEVCTNCYGLCNMNHTLLPNNNYLIQPKEKIKIYKISSTTFENKDIKDTEKSEKQNINKILTTMKKNIRKNSKKS
jgi:hypothetical protein